MSRELPSLAGRVCLVTGASRGIGKGIALMLGKAGATVYITGRTLKSTPDKTGSLTDVAKEVTYGSCFCLFCFCFSLQPTTQTVEGNLTLLKSR